MSSAEEILQAGAAARAEKARRHLAEFLRQSWHVLEPSTPLLPGWHLDAISLHVQATIEDWARRQHDPAFVQRMRNLLINIAPGTLKSRVLVCAVPWAWLRWPSLRVIALSANPRVALRDSAYAREIISSEWYQRTFAPAWKVRDDEDGKALFSNTAGGFRSAHGVDARIVGTRADLLLGDDLHDPEEALSDAQRESVIERWCSSISNRVNDLSSSVRIVIGQRVHEADISAALLAEGDWAHLNLPTLFEADHPCVTPIGWRDPRKIDGESLHPARFTPEVVAKEKAKGTYYWSSQHQQRPTPVGGGMLKRQWYRFWRRPGAPDAAAARPRGCWQGPAVELPSSFTATVISADLSMGRNTKAGDFCAIQAWAKSGASFFLLEQWHARADMPEILAAFRAMSERYPYAAKYVEAAAAGHALVGTLEREIPGLLAVPAQGSKLQRLQAIAHFVEASNVHLPEDWNGLEGFLSESDSFPLGRHDDALDALALALAHLPAASDEMAGWIALGRIFGDGEGSEGANLSGEQWLAQRRWRGSPFDR